MATASSNDFSNLNPRLISFRTGGLITGVIGILMMPWKLLTDFNSYIFGWLVGYSGLLGPIAGIMIADYFLVRSRMLNADALYRRGGIYEYSNGFNYRALTALVLGVAVALVGLLIPAVVQQLLPGNLRVPVSSSSVIVAFLVSCATGLFFGYLPANQAARLEPIESLRYE